ncbi:MAG: purine-nucleoside phosphorylase [Bacteroidota bacterium]|nr:purine-nucleoside phosphorylase [Bacteroidota bacterium]
MKAKLGIILGSGLNKFAEELSSQKIIYEDDASFHKLKVLSGKINDQNITLFSGRRHYYEGNAGNNILRNINIAKKQGLKFLIITNAAGGINNNFHVPDLMLITSHLNFVNQRIPSKANTIFYDKKIIESVKKISREEKINIRQGSYCCMNGPMYETNSEIRFLAKLGIDAVGMSTIPEIIYANKIGIKTLAISCITNLLFETSVKGTNHEEVIEAGKNAYTDFSRLIKKIISKSSEILN